MILWVKSSASTHEEVEIKQQKSFIGVKIPPQPSPPHGQVIQEGGEDRTGDLHYMSDACSSCRVFIASSCLACDQF